MPDHLAAELAARAHLLTLVVCTTGVTTLEATATGYQRAAGSFVADGFAVGMEVAPSGFGDTTPGAVTAVTALTMSIDGGRTVEAAGAGRSLSVGVPAQRAWDNVALEDVVAGRPYIAESYVPATSRTTSFPALTGTLEDTGLYVLRWYAKASAGAAALRKPATAVLALFKAGTALAVSGVSGAGYWRVRTDIAPWAGEIRQLEGGFALVVVTIPWRWENINS